MSTPVVQLIPSAVRLRPIQTVGFHPIDVYKIPIHLRTVPASVALPAVKVALLPQPPVTTQTIAFSNAIQSFTESLTETAAFYEKLETSSQASLSIKITPENAKTLKQAFETLQNQLQEGIKLLPETKQPLPKVLLQILVQTPAFIEQLGELAGKAFPKQPVLEEAEVPIELPLDNLQPEVELLQELQRNVPGFVKTLQAAFQTLPTAFPQNIKEALQGYLLSPVVQENLLTISEAVTVPPDNRVQEEPVLQQPEVLSKEKTPQPQLQQLSSEISLPEIPEQNLVEPTITPLIETEATSQEIAEQNLVEPTITPLIETEATSQEIAEQAESKILETNIVKTLSTQPQPELPTLNEILEKELVQGKSVITPEQITSRLAAQPLEAPATTPSLSKLPELALKEVLIQSYPLLKTLLELIQKESLISKELVALLKQIPVFVEQLVPLLLKNIDLLTPEEKELLGILYRFIPSVMEKIKAEVLQLPTFLFPEVREKLDLLIKNFPLKEVISFLENRTPLTPEKTPVVADKVSIPVPVDQAPTPEVSYFGNLSENAIADIINEAYPYFIQSPEKTDDGGPSKIQSPITLPVFLAETIRQEEKPVKLPPEFSTNIPFAFIVPYVPTNPISTPPPDVKITPHDPSKEEFKEPGGQVGAKSVQMLAYVPRGETWHGDISKKGGQRRFMLHSYAIGVYCVTNQQFASFLTEQSRLKNIFIGEKGQVFSKDKTLLCQIKTGTIESDILVEPAANYLIFSVTPEKEAYPVVCVTYHGAKAFCVAGGFRLPSDAEWEKAASLEMTEKNRVKRKFLFGCSQDEITPAFANYGVNPSTSKEVFTKPVGFYNGVTTSVEDGNLVQTFDARSPFGCYDMSGNVWEWIGEEENGLAIVRGGCFKSGLEDLRVFVKKTKSTDSLDGYTGFRVAIS